MVFRGCWHFLAGWFKLSDLGDVDPWELGSLDLVSLIRRASVAKAHPA